MSDIHLNTALAYYKAMNNKDSAEIGKFLHPEMTVISPLAIVKGKEAALQSIKGFYSFFKSLAIRAQFSAGDQVMLAMDIIFPEPIGLFRGASLLTFKDGLIKEVELFYDARPLENNKGKIFARN